MLTVNSEVVTMPVSVGDGVTVSVTVERVLVVIDTPSDEGTGVGCAVDRREGEGVRVAGALGVRVGVCSIAVDDVSGCGKRELVAIVL